LLLFRLVLPAIKLTLPMIAGDLIVGAGYLIGAGAALSRNGVDSSSVVATGAVVSAVVAISLQSTLGNLLGGVALQLDGSLHEGDFIRLADGHQGQIRAIRWRHTLVETGDHTTIVVPNSMLLANNITILGLRDGHSAPQRVTIDFFVDVLVAPTTVLKTVTDALIDSPIPNVARDPQLSVVCAEMNADGIARYTVRFFLVDPMTKTTSSRVLVRVHAALSRAGIQLARKTAAGAVDATDRYLAALHQIGLFASLEDAELRVLAGAMNHAPYAANETIAHQGAEAHSLFILTAGTVEVRTKYDADGAGPAPEHVGVVATLVAPDFFGEMGLMTGQPRRADVVAKTDVECFRLRKEAVEQVVKDRPEIAKSLSEMLAKRNVGLRAVREGLDEKARAEQHAHERERIYSGIRRFFGLAGEEIERDK
jgi:CRP-like cAMP-binding protein